MKPFELQKQFAAGISLSIFATSLIVLPGHAIPIEQIPNPKRTQNTWVSDTANLLSPATETKLNQTIDELEATTGIEIAVVSVRDTTPEPSPKAFATKLFNHWGIGKATQNNGILFLIAKQNQRVEIETGRGIQQQFPDAEVSKLVNTQIVPTFKQGKFEEGTVNAITQISTNLSRSPAPQLTATPAFSPEASARWDVLWPLFAGLGTIAGGIFAILKFQRRSLAPTGTSRMNAADWFSSPVYCTQCHSKMHELSRDEVPTLSQCNSDVNLTKDIQVKIWQCPSCAAELEGNPYHVRIQDVRRASAITASASSDPHTGGIDYNYTSSSDSSFSSSGGSDFGGGSSDGGGAGGSW
jgi:uncharacterized protein